MFGRHVEEAILAHAREAWPEECCGLVAGDAYHRCRNIAAEPRHNFEIAPSDYLVATQVHGPIQAVVHSHPESEGAFPSRLDMEGQMQTGVPWGIVSVNAQAAYDLFWWGDGVPVPPLVGRQFRHGVTDCYSLIRDWFRLERGILLPEFPREDGWWRKGGNDYVEGFGRAGFTCYATGMAGKDLVQPGDVILFSLENDTPPHHGAVYLGRGLILHHLASGATRNRLSKREPIGGRVRQATHWLKHKDIG